MLDRQTEKRIDELLSEMTVSEKVGQLVQIDSIDKDPETIKRLIREGKVGSFILSGICSWDYECEGSVKNRERMNEYQRIAVEESRLGIPIINGHDVIHGWHTGFPDPLAMAAGFNPELVEKSYRAIAKECANDAVHWSFSPMLDLSHDPRWGRCTEGPGEDPYLGAKMAEAAVKGFQGDDLSAHDGIAACAKHYIGYGTAEGGRDYHKGEISDQTLRNYYLPAFRSAVNAGVCTVMNAFNDINGLPAASNKYLLTDVLRGELGFEGFVISDDHAIEQLVKHGTAEDNADAASQAISAGLDMDMRDDVYLENLEKCVEDGTVSVDVLDEAVRRVLRIKMRLGLFEHPYTEVVPVDYNAHSELSREMADETVVLLKNNGILPLAKDTHVCIYGYLQDNIDLSAGCWAGGISRSRVAVFSEAMKKIAEPAGGSVEGHAGHYLDVNFAWAGNPDVAVLLLGQTPYMDGENANVTSLELSEDQKAIIKEAKRLGKPMVAVIRAGRPLALESIAHYFDAIIWGWHNGTEGASSLAAAVYGDLNPNGKLSITIPRVTGQEPIYYNQTSSCRHNEGYYGNDRIRNYRDCNDSPMYPFGYGLSYTTFEYSDLHAVRPEIGYDEIMAGGAFEIKVKVKNTGKREGKEVVQCYIHDCLAKITRPIRELKGFDKQSYLPDEEKEITFRLTKDELGYWDNHMSYVVEAGKFKVWVGGSCYAEDEIEIKITK